MAHRRRKRQYSTIGLAKIPLRRDARKLAADHNLSHEQRTLYRLSIRSHPAGAGVPAGLLIRILICVPCTCC
jgi:hypothetical protein